MLHKLAFQMHFEIAIKILGGKINKLKINNAEVNQSGGMVFHLC